MVTSLKITKMLFRAWFYFRTGYSIYIAFFIGFIGNIIVIYSLAIKPSINTPGSATGSLLELLFPHLTNFLLIAAVIAVPVCVYIGIFHMRRTGAFEADASVQTEQNPYVYKAQPGKEQEVLYPLIMLTAQGLAKMLDQQNSMTPEEKRRFEEAIEKAEMLIKGKPVGIKK